MNVLLCPSRQELSLFSAGRLDDGSASEIATHLDACENCRTTIEEISNSSDPLAASLRHGALVPFSQEAGYQKALAFVQEIGVDASRSPAAGKLPPGIPASLTAIRDYEILEKIGEGGMGAVYKARHARLKKIVAIKVLPSDRMEDAHAVARFSREMEAVGKLEHPNLVRAMDAGEQEGIHYLVMEYVAGSDLSQLVRQQGQLPIGDACDLIRQAALGLQNAHEHGLVHRDIKPSNLILSTTGTLKILDLGLALLGGETGGRELTTTGQMMGTLDYMAPEQGSSSHTVDIRADIYSLGATLYKLLTGQAPFGGEKYVTPVQKMMALATETPAPVESLCADISPDLAAIVTKMLARDPNSRYSTPAQVALALEPHCRPPQCRPSFQDGPGTDSAPPKTSSTEKHLSSSMTGTHANQCRPSFQDGQEPTLPTIKAVSPNNSTPAPRPLPARLGKTAYIPAYIAAAIALLLLAGGGIYYTITILIKNKDGKVIAKVEVQEGTKAEIQQDGKKIAEIDPSKPAPLAVTPVPSAEAPAKPAATVPSVKLIPDKLPALADNAPLSPTALVSRPAKLPGVESWTIETIGHRSAVRAIELSSEGKLFASGGDDGVLRIWNTNTGKLVRLIVAHSSVIGPESLAWSPGNRYIATGSDKTAKIWDVNSGQLVKSISCEAAVRAVSWSPNAKEVATVLESLQTVIWDVASGKSQEVIEDFGTGKVIWSMDGDRLYGQQKQTIGIWNRRNKKVETKECECQGDVALALSTDERFLAVGGNNIRIFDTTTWKQVKGNPQAANNYGWDNLQWTDANDRLTGVAGDGEILIWSPEKSEREITTRPFGSGGSVFPKAAVSGDGKLIILASVYGSIRLFDVGLKEVVQTIDPSEDWVTTGSFSPTGRRFCAGNEQENWVWDLSTLEPDSRFNVGTDKIEVSAYAWSKDDALLAFSNHSQGNIYTSSGNSTQLPVQFSRGGLNAAMDISPDAKLLAFGGPIVGTSAVSVFDLEKRSLRSSLAGSKDTVYSVHFSHDGKLLAAGGQGGSLAIWSLDKDSPAQIPESSANGNIWWIVWSKDDKSLLLKLNNGLVVFDLETKKWLNVKDINFTDFPEIHVGSTNDMCAIRTNDGFELYDCDSNRLLERRVYRGYRSASTNDNQVYAIFGVNGTTLFEMKSGRPLGHLLRLPENEWMSLSPDGHLKVSNERVRRGLVYVVQTAEGQQTLTPAQFAEKYGWKNDPSKVKLE